MASSKRRQLGIMEYFERSNSKKLKTAADGDEALKPAPTDKLKDNGDFLVAANAATSGDFGEPREVNKLIKNSCLV